MDKPLPEFMEAVKDVFGPEGANPGDYLFFYGEDYEDEEEAKEGTTEAE